MFATGFIIVVCILALSMIEGTRRFIDRRRHLQSIFGASFLVGVFLMSASVAWKLLEVMP